MSRGPHFSSNERAENELGYEVVPIEKAIREAVADFVARGLVPGQSIAQLEGAAERERSIGRPAV